MMSFKGWQGVALVGISAVMAVAGLGAAENRESEEAHPAPPRFEEVTEQAGVFYRGCGKCVAFGDMNEDGALDLYSAVVYGSDLFFTNRGDGAFTDASALLEIDEKSDGHGAVFADFDNDGHTDLFVASNPEAGSDPTRQLNRLYMGPDMHNAAQAAGVEGTFIVPIGKTNELRLNRSCGIALGDYDNDGDLDLYLAKGAYEPGHPNELYLNESTPGKPKFRNIAAEAGVDDPGAGSSGGSYVCAFADFDSDGFPDLFLGNLDLQNNDAGMRLFRNRGNGSFVDVSQESGVNGHGFCTGCAVGDVDNDGDLDLLAVFGDNKRPSALFINEGGFTFREAAAAAGLGDVIPAARGCCLGDVDHNGYLDILVASFDGGKLFLNQGDGTFRECIAQAGISNPGMHGCTLADVDNDGDLDLYSSNWYIRQMQETGRFLLHRNTLNNGNWLKVLVKGTVSNRSAVGARVSVYDAGHAGDVSHLRGFREVFAGTGVFASPPLVQHFGVDGAGTYDVVVRFPRTGRKKIVNGAAAKQTLTIEEPWEFDDFTPEMDNEAARWPGIISIFTKGGAFEGGSYLEAVKDAGFGAYHGNPEHLPELRKHGLKLFAWIDDEGNSSRRLRDEPDVLGYWGLYPTTPAQWPEVAERESKLREADPNHPVFYALEATWGQPDAYVRTINPRIIWYRHYLWEGHHPEDEFHGARWAPMNEFIYLEAVRRAALEAGLPVVRWVHVTDQVNMRYTVSMSLVYGIRGFTWWQGWCFFDLKKKDARGLPLRGAGGDEVARMNRMMKAYAPVFQKARCVAAGHSWPWPLGYATVPQGYWAHPGGQHITMGVFIDGEGNHYHVLGNRHLEQANDALVHFKRPVEGVSIMDKETGKWKPVKVEKDDAGNDFVKVRLDVASVELLWPQPAPAHQP